MNSRSTTASTRDSEQLFHNLRVSLQFQHFTWRNWIVVFLWRPVKICFMFQGFFCFVFVATKEEIFHFLHLLQPEGDSHWEGWDSETTATFRRLVGVHKKHETRRYEVLPVFVLKAQHYDRTKPLITFHHKAEEYGGILSLFKFQHICAWKLQYVTEKSLWECG